VRAHGTPLVIADAPAGLTHAFPQPATLAGADIATIGMPRARAAALSALAAVAAQEVRLFAPERDLEETIARLRELPGVGEWTAQYIAMRGLREPDAFPATDIGLLRAMEDEMGRRPMPAELLARAAAWRPWRAYAALHLWAADSQRIGQQKRPRTAAALKESADVRSLA
jgi:AraC family transcriptional regulator, regulatory protein of adaptative response / DNA-3-methyladenine glycosylase II